MFELEFLGIGFGAISVAYAYTLTKYWQARGLYPIRYRWPWLAIMKMVFFYMMQLFFYINYAYDDKVTCGFFLIFSILLIPGLMASNVIQLLVLYLASVVVSDSEQFKDLKYLTHRQSEVKKTGTAWFLKYRKYFRNSTYAGTTVAMVALYEIPYIILAASRPRGFWSQLQCTDFSITGVGLGELLTYFLLFVIFMKRLLRLDENLGIRAEWKVLMIIPVPYLIGYFIHAFSPTGSVAAKVSAVVIVAYFPAIIGLCSSILYPLMEANRAGYVRTSKLSKTGPFGRAAAAMQPRSLQATLSAEAQPILDANGKGVHPNVKDLMLLLSIPEGFEIFKAFAKREFSVENLLFYAAVREYKKTYSESIKRGPSGEVQIRQRFEAICDKFIHEESQFCINIDSANRENIVKFSENNGLFSSETNQEVVAFQLSSTPPKEVFDPALNMIMSLLSMDTFKRFKLTDEYASFKTTLMQLSNMDEVTEILGIASEDTNIKEPSLSAKQ